MALHSVTRQPRNPAVGDMTTSLGCSNRLAVVAGADLRHSGVYLFRLTPFSGASFELPVCHASACAFTTTVDCTGAGSVVVLAQTSEPQCNPSCVPAFHRVGGWGVRPATRIVRYRFNNAVFPAASRSLTVIFRSPWSASIPALPRESGEVSQPGCRCYVPKRFVATAASVVLALRLGLLSRCGFFQYGKVNLRCWL